MNGLWVFMILFMVGGGVLDNCKKNHIIAFVFAGRKEYLSIQMQYLNRLMKKGVLHEVHLWQYTRNKRDTDYLDSISNLHKTSARYPEYRNIFPVIRDNSFKLDVRAKSDAHILINNKYEIIIGAYENTKSVMKKIKESKNEIEFMGGALDQNKSKEFVMNLRNNVLSVNDIMSLKVDDDEITSVSIHTGLGIEGYWNYEEEKNKNVKLFDTKRRKLWFKWDETYSYYTNYSFDVLLKIDDDIVYMDLNRYDEFINFIKSNPGKMCVFPNVINHAVCLYYNNKNNLVPDKILHEQYVGKQSADEIYNYYKDGSQASKIHEYFLSNIDLFTKNNISVINLDKHFMSICMFGILKENYNKVFDVDMNKVRDEEFVYGKSGNIMYPRFVVCHYQFGPQMNSGLDKRFLAEYMNLSQKNKK